MLLKNSDKYAVFADVPEWPNGLDSGTRGKTSEVSREKRPVA